MEEIILSVPTTDAEEVAKQLADLDIEAEPYTGRAFDGGAVASFIIVMTPLVLPHLVKMYTARQETQRATKLKYKGVELTGASDKLLKTLIDKLDSAKPDKDA
jgi:hypothetical protein